MNDTELLHYLICGAACLLVAAIVDAFAFWVDGRCHFWLLRLRSPRLKGKNPAGCAGLGGKPWKRAQSASASERTGMTAATGCTRALAMPLDSSHLRMRFASAIRV